MYINIKTGDIVTDESAYDYAKLNLDSLSLQEKYDFVDWFYSGNWLHRTLEEVEEECAQGGIGASYMEMILSQVKGGYPID